MHPHSSVQGFTFEEEELNGSLPKRFARVVSQFPDYPAIKMRTRTLSYADLDRASNQVARALITQYGKACEPVVLLFEKGIDSLIAIFGVLKAGKYYVAIDPAIPQDRMRAILHNVQARVIVTNAQNHASATHLAHHVSQILTITEMQSGFSDHSINLDISPDALSMIFYTSGTTGIPKGVCQTHRLFLHNARNYITDHGIGSPDRVAALFSYSFAASATVIFYTLLSGATLYPYDVQKTGPTYLAEWLIQEGITILQPSMGVLRQLFDILHGREHLLTLRRIFVGGQTMYPHDVAHFQRDFPESCLLIYRFVTTETAGTTQIRFDHQMTITPGIVPVGYARHGKNIFVLDESGNTLSDNQVGEIAVQSRYLSSGYWHDPELTRQKFLPDPDGGDKRIFLTGDLGRLRSDGCLEYLGRKDFMVKIRGYRVVLTEIEAALYALETVKEAVVVAKERTEGEKFLVAYIVPAATPAPTISALRQALAQTLPDYMLPSFFVFLDALPLTPTGKPDRQSLPEPDYTRPALANPFVAPQNDTEQRLADIWTKTLGLDRVGIHDNFFDLGGNSLSAGKVLSDIKQAFGADLPMSTLFQRPTIAQLLDQLRQPQVSSPALSSVIPIQPRGTLPPLFFIYPLGQVALHYNLQGTHALAQLLGPEQPFYGVRYGLGAIQDVEQLPAPPKQLDTLAALYLKEIQTLQSQGPYFLCGRSIGGLVAYEMARQLHAQGQTLGLVALLDTHHPQYRQYYRASMLQRVQAGFNRFVNPYNGLRAQFATGRYVHHVRHPNAPRLLGVLAGLRKVASYAMRGRLAKQVQGPVEPYPGKIVLFESEQITGLCSSRWGWEHSALGGVEIVPVPGWHGNMMETEPNLNAMAEQLRICLQRAHEVQ